MTFEEIREALLRIADSHERVETDAASPEQIELCGAILKLANQAPTNAFLIYSQAMSEDDWAELASLYRNVGDLAATQAHVVESNNTVDKATKDDADG